MFPDLYESREKVVQIFNNYEKNMSSLFTNQSKVKNLRK